MYVSWKILYRHETSKKAFERNIVEDVDRSIKMLRDIKITNLTSY